LSRKDNLLDEERRLADEERERIRLQKEAEKAAREEERAKRAAAKRRKEEQGIFGELLDQVGRSAKRQISNELGKTITRSIFGGLFGKR
jgi:hypothetical protein